MLNPSSYQKLSMVSVDNLPTTVYSNEMSVFLTRRIAGRPPNLEFHGCLALDRQS